MSLFYVIHLLGVALSHVMPHHMIAIPGLLQLHAGKFPFSLQLLFPPLLFYLHYLSVCCTKKRIAKNLHVVLYRPI